MMNMSRFQHWKADFDSAFFHHQVAPQFYAGLLVMQRKI